MKPLERIAIVSNATKEGTRMVGENLKCMAEEFGVEVCLTTEFPVPEGWLVGMDACFVVGGDGTLLNLMREAVDNEVPVAHSSWSVGFSCHFPEHLSTQIPPLFRGEYQISRRSMLSHSKTVLGRAESIE